MSIVENINCCELRHDLAEVKTLAEEFLGVYEKGVAKRNMQPALTKQGELEVKLNSLKNKIEPKVFRELRKTEETKLTEFFGQPIEVPKLPEEITRKKIEKWKEQGFELHFLPDMKMYRENEYPGWRKKPEDWLYKLVDSGQLLAGSIELKKGWVLIDGRQKPIYRSDGNHMYDHDVLGPSLVALRQRGIIADLDNTDSRYKINYEELESIEVKKAFSDILNVTIDKISLPKAIEFNVLGNLHYNQWGKTETSERFSDILNDGRGLAGGCSGSEGIADVFSTDAGSLRSGAMGFRLIVRFSDSK